MTGELRELYLRIQNQLLVIEALLPKTYRLTLIARYTESHLKDADLILTLDDLDKVIASIERLKERDPAIIKEARNEP